jgi:hypothetical protein
LPRHRRQSDKIALAGVCGGQRPPRSSLLCGRPQVRERRRVVLWVPRDRRFARAVSARPLPSARAARRSSRGRSLGRSPGDDEIVVLQSPPKDCSRIALRGRRSSMMSSDPKSARPLLPQGVLSPAVRCEASRLTKQDTPVTCKSSTPARYLDRAPARPPKRLGKVRPTGKKLEAKPGDDLCEPGSGVRPLRPANATAMGRGGRGPGLEPIVGRRRDKFKVRQPTRAPGS